MYLFRRPKKEPFALITDLEADKWAIQRAPGKLRWIFKNAAIYAVISFSIGGLISAMFGIGFDISLFGLFLYLPAGIFLGYLGWNQGEYQYQRFLAARSGEKPHKEAFLNFETEI